jgi:hypothetical protein
MIDSGQDHGDTSIPWAKACRKDRGRRERHDEEQQDDRSTK